MKVILMGVAGAVLIGVCIALLRPEPPVTNYPSSGTDVIAFGDSLIAGIGATPQNDLVSLLEAEIGEEIINLGVSGDTTRDALKRLSEIDAYNPKVVMVLFGGNDAIQNIPLSETKANLASIITDLHARGSVVLLLGVRGGLLGSGGFADMYDELHKEYGTEYVPDVLSGVFGRPALMADPIHPNNEGYQKIAERIAPVLKSIQ